MINMDAILKINNIKQQIIDILSINFIRLI